MQSNMAALQGAFQHTVESTKFEQLSIELPSSMRRILTREEQQLCLEAYFVATARPPELQTYLRSVAEELFSRSVTIGYFVDGKIVGGFSIVTTPPIPVLDVLPDTVRHAFVREVSEDDIASVSFFWLNENLRGFVHSARLWWCMLNVVRQLDRPFLMYSYNARERRNWQLYKRGGRSTNIYEGMLKNGAVGGVDYLPLDHLSGPLDFLAGFLGRSRRKDQTHLTLAGRRSARIAQLPSIAAST